MKSKTKVSACVILSICIVMVSDKYGVCLRYMAICIVMVNSKSKVFMCVILYICIFMESSMSKFFTYVNMSICSIMVNFKTTVPDCVILSICIAMVSIARVRCSLMSIYQSLVVW